LIIHNGIILDLVCGFGGSVDEDVRADFSSVEARKSLSFYFRRVDVRSDDFEA